MSDRLEAGDPERIGEFWLSGRLGVGGQGVVYDAYGPDGSRVAIKVLHGAQESPVELARMAAEARAAQRVASFCTARILQVRLAPPRPYIVSEYIDGLSLQDTVKGTGGRPGRRFGGNDLHRLAIGIVTALTAIHQARVVHRDLKPGNVMLGPDGDGPPIFRTWDVTTGRETRPAVPLSADTAREPLSAWPDEIVVAPDGRTFVTGNLYGQLRLWDPAAQRGFALEGGPKARISAMAISPDGRILATGGGSQSEMIDPSVDGKVQLWDLRTRTLITKRPLFSSLTEVSALAFSPDNRTLAIGATNMTVLWDVRDRRQIGTPLTGHSGAVTVLAFSRDGKTLATGGDDQVVKLWDVAGQSQIGAPLVGHTGAVRSLVFNPDTTTLTTSDDRATVRRWNIAMPADPAATACAIAGRTLTRAEWAQYVPPGIDYRDICPSLSQPR